MVSSIHGSRPQGRTQLKEKMETRQETAQGLAQNKTNKISKKSRRVGFAVFSFLLMAMDGRRWESSSDESSSERPFFEELGDTGVGEKLNEDQRKYLDIGPTFLAASKLGDWFRAWPTGEKFTYASDCLLSGWGCLLLSHIPFMALGPRQKRKKKLRFWCGSTSYCSFDVI